VGFDKFDVKHLLTLLVGRKITFSTRHSTPVRFTQWGVEKDLHARSMLQEDVEFAPLPLFIDADKKPRSQEQQRRERAPPR
jgi:hypothetical protein